MKNKDELAMFVLSLYEQVNLMLDNSYGPTLGHHEAFNCHQGNIILGGLPLILVQSRTELVLYESVWNTSKQLRYALEPFEQLIAKYLPRLNVSHEPGYITTPDHRLYWHSDLGFWVTGINMASERAAVVLFLKNGYLKNHNDLKLYKTKSGVCVTGKPQEDRSNLFEISPGKIVASKHRAKHIQDVLEEYAQRNGLTIKWRASVTRKRGEKVSFYPLPWLNRDDHELLELLWGTTEASQPAMSSPEVTVWTQGVAVSDRLNYILERNNGQN